jgi:hypothetical protein
MHNSFPVFAFSLTLKSFTNVLLRAISFTVLLSASISSSSTPVFPITSSLVANQYKTSFTLIFTTFFCTYWFRKLLSNNLEKVSLDLTKDSSDFLNVALEVVSVLFFFKSSVAFLRSVMSKATISRQGSLSISVSAKMLISKRISFFYFVR